ncbi:MAG: S9 family peptidase, partial [Gemmatimonadales bacterium]
IYRLRDVHDPQRSPDGKWVAYTVSSVDTIRDRNSSDIWLVSWDGAQQKQLTSTPESESSPRWSPDGEWISFLSSREGTDGAQLWLVSPSGGAPQRVSSVPGGIGDYAWSPDSKRLVFVVGDPIAVEAKSGTKLPIVVNRYHFKSDPGGYLRGAHDHLVLFDIAARHLEPLTSGDFDDSDPVWSPDGTRIAFVSKRVAGDPDRSVNDDIFIIDAKPGVRPRRLTSYAGEDDGRIAWSPDGGRIAYLTGIGLPDHSFRMWKLAVIPSAGGKSTVLSASLDRQVIEPAWSADGSSIYVLEEDDRSQYVARISAVGGQMQRVAGDKRMVTSLAIGRDGAATITAASDSEPPEIYALEGNSLRRLTHQNDAWLREVQLGTTEEFASRGRDGYEVHGLLVKPAAYVAGRRYPTLLRIHGGPACCQDAHAFNFERELFAANGYVVIAANYRGSRGRGARHQRAIAGGTKEKELSDLLGAVDYVVRIGIADTARLGVGGWSNGAILTDQIIAVDHRFKAAIAGAGSANALASYGTDQYTPETNEGPWSDPQAWMRRSYA